MKNSNPIICILIAGLIAGTLDILAAIFLLAGGDAVGVLKYIASGAFGKSAIAGGNEMAVWGLVFHFIIALSWAAIYFLVYRKFPFLKRNKWLSAIIYGTLIWAVMNLVVVPLSQIGYRGFNWLKAAENMLILIICIALPVTLSADKFYREKQ